MIGEMSVDSTPRLTIFTPAYNRRELLYRCYQSLQRQTSKEFIWLIVDDGSTDGTGEWVRKWQAEESDFEIQYIYQENGGLHTGYNTAIANISTELSMCIDSDDFAADNCVELVMRLWNEKGGDEYAGIIGLDFDLKGNCLRDPLPARKSIDLIALMCNKYHIKNGDRQMVIRTDLYKKYAPMRGFPGEKNFNPSYMHIQIALEKEFLVLNECLRYVEYQPAGMSNSLFKQYYNSPNSFAKMRLLTMSLPDMPLWFLLKENIHYCSSCILAHRKDMVQRSPRKLMTVLAIAPGWLLSRIIKYKNGKDGKRI